MGEYHERPDSGEYAPLYAGYVARVPAGDIVGILRRQVGETRALFEELGEERGDHAYAPGKWTIKEVVGHLADSERLLSCRALRFARGDETELPGFDEKAYAPAGRFGRRSLRSLLDELEAVRAATVALFDGLPEEAWLRRGVANRNPVTVRALAWIIAGHELHHREILKTRYLAGAPAG